MINLGAKVKDRVTGFDGIVTARCEHLDGTVQFMVEPKWQHDAMPIDGRWFDQARLDSIE